MTEHQTETADSHCDPHTDVAHCPHCQEPTYLERQASIRTYHSDALGAVTIPEDDA